MTAAATASARPATEGAREVHEFEINWGLHGILQLISAHHADFHTVLDVGSGSGEHSRFFRLFGKQVFSLDLHEEADYVGDFMGYDFDRKFDAVWCSHVLEHQRNVGQFLEKLYDVIEDAGFLAISLPVHPRDRVVSGHITSWNAGLLIYNLVLAGFDCSEAMFMHGYDLSLIVRKKASSGGDVRMAAAYANVEDLAKYFPFPVKEHGDAEVKNHNWSTNYPLVKLDRPATIKIKNKVIGTINAKLG
jgi:SAM-dependent methyltransferase